MQSIRHFNAGQSSSVPHCVGLQEDIELRKFMKHAKMFLALIAAAGLMMSACNESADEKTQISGSNPALAGVWKASIQFSTGAFAPVKDLEFMYAFHQDGTMTESSNYDAAPPVPPAYGVWKQTDARIFEAHYEFFMTAAPDSAARASGIDGWVPAGRGILTETITLSEDGNSFSSNLKFEAFDKSGKLTDMGGVATGAGLRMVP
jgi:hypothetical protein